MARILKLNELQTIRDRFLVAAGRLDTIAGDFSARIESVRGDASLTDVGKSAKLGPILKAMDAATGPLMSELRQLATTAKDQKRPWKDPMTVLKIHESPALGPDTTNAMVAISTCKTATLLEVQLSTPAQRQKMLEIALAFETWWEVPLILAGAVNQAGGSILEEFDGVAHDELMAVYPKWRAGLVLIQEVEAHSLRVEMLISNVTKPTINPLRKLALGRALAEVEKLKDGKGAADLTREASWQARHDRGEPARLQARIEKVINS